MLLGENPGVLDVISYFYVFSDENSDGADVNNLWVHQYFLLLMLPQILCWVS